jgi:serine protease Do
MKMILLTGLAVLCAASAGVFATLHYQDHAAIQTLKSEMTSLERTSSPSATDTSVPADSLVDAVSKVIPSVVRIDFTGDGVVGVGSGFIITGNGYVVTNQHVISEALSISVTLSTGDAFDATVVDSNADRDLALLKMSSSRTDFPEIGLATASIVQAGTTVAAVGYPLGLELSGSASVTTGIVSAIRNVNGYDFIQTDAAINPGNSGGPLVDLLGQVVGICSANITAPDFTVEGMGLAIPISDCLDFLADGKVACSSCHGDKVP